MGDSLLQMKANLFITKVSINFAYTDSIEKKWEWEILEQQAQQQ
jgi:hypothetical protein